MAYFNEFPNTRTYDSDLGWLIRSMRQLAEDIQDINSIKYHDPIGWNITTQYERNTIVKDPNTGILYLSKQPVPTGISLSNGDYWLEIGDMSYNIDFLKAAMAIPDEGTALQSANAYTEKDIFWWQDELYQATSNITIGDYLDPNTNIEKISLGDLITKLQKADETLSTAISDTQSDLDDLTEYVENALQDPKYIIIGDSYLNEISHPDNILTYMRQYLGLTVGTNLWSSAVSGNGFYMTDSGNTVGNGFLAQLQTYDNVIPKEKITHIVVLGGMNDRHDIEDNGATSNQTLTNVKLFCSYAKTNFPNAKVYIGMVGCSRLVAIRRELRSVVRQYQEGCAQSTNAYYLYGSDFALKNYSRFDNDNHPNSVGFFEIAETIMNGIKTGNALKLPKIDAQLQSAISAYGDGSSISTQTFNSMYFNGGIRVNLGGALTYTLASPITTRLINNTRYNVGKLNTTRCFGVPFNSQFQPCNCMVILSDNSEMNCDYAFFHFEEENGDVIFKPLIHFHSDANVTIKALRFYSGSMYFDITEV